MRSMLLNVAIVNPDANLPPPIQHHVSRIFPADRCFIVSFRSRGSPVVRNQRLFSRPIALKLGASSS